MSANFSYFRSPSFDGLHNLLAELDAHDRKLPEKAEQIVKKTVLDGAGLASAGARVDTGASKAAIEASPLVSKDGEGVHGEWGSGGIHYDIYQEYGTSRGVSPNWHHRNAFERVAPTYETALSRIAGLE